jgi:hypothetical protein
MKKILLLLGPVMICQAIGCDLARYTYYLIAPRKTETFHAEYGGLAGKKLAVLVYMDDRVHSDYPAAHRQITQILAGEFLRASQDSDRGGRRELEDLELIDYEKVLQFQRAHPLWSAMDRGEIASQLGADYVLLVSIREFSTQDDPNVELYRGNLLATASLYDASKPRGKNCVWPVRGKHKDSFSHTFPKEGPVGVTGRSDAVVRQGVMRVFAETLTRRFYTYKIEVDPNDPSNSPHS